MELLLALAMAALLLAGLSGVIERALHVRDAVHGRHDRVREARFALERMTRAVGRSPRLVLPLPDNPSTLQDEAVRDVLAVILDPTLDRDGDGFADADNDRDGQIDEDPGADLNDDGEAGIKGIDDDGDGQIDEGSKEDDDEDEDLSNKDEEILDGLDDDGDGAVDEDLARDLSQDGAPGLIGVDDDGDGLTDESSQEDDDEDEDQRGTKDEDWWDTVVYFVSDGDLVERLPNPHAVTGLDYAEHVIAEGVSVLRIERLPPAPNQRALLVELRLELAEPGGGRAVLTSRVRLGGEL